jgi:hypothetical protein
LIVAGAIGLFYLFVHSNGELGWVLIAPVTLIVIRATWLYLDFIDTMLTARPPERRAKGGKGKMRVQPIVLVLKRSVICDLSTLITRRRAVSNCRLETSSTFRHRHRRSELTTMKNANNVRAVGRCCR